MVNSSLGSVRWRIWNPAPPVIQTQQDTCSVLAAHSACVCLLSLCILIGFSVRMETHFKHGCFCHSLSSAASSFFSTIGCLSSSKQKAPASFSLQNLINMMKTNVRGCWNTARCGDVIRIPNHRNVSLILQPNKPAQPNNMAALRKLPAPPRTFMEALKEGEHLSHRLMVSQAASCHPHRPVRWGRRVIVLHKVT